MPTLNGNIPCASKFINQLLVSTVLNVWLNFAYLTLCLRCSKQRACTN